VHIVVLITTKNREESERIATALVENKLIACANIIDGIQSVFWWQEKVDRAQESLLVLKSRKSCFSKIVKTVKSLHSYEVPEIIALPIIGGSKDYLKWIDESCAA
jgi:periplasmic divalent cation tolerance protein